MDGWRALADALAADISAVTDTPEHQHHASLTTRLVQLKQQAAENYDSLPAYERRRQADIISDLETQLKNIHSTSVSTTGATAKFSFNRTRKNAVNKPNNPLQPFDAGNEEAPGSGSSSSSVNQLRAIVDKRVSLLPPENKPENVRPSTEENQHAPVQTTRLGYITLSSLNDTSTSASLNNLDRCIVDLRDSSGDPETEETCKTAIPALYIENISNSLVIATNIRGSALIHNASNCVFVLKCHQFRMHTSSNVKIIIDTDSTPIIEKCSSIQFGSSGGERALEILDFDKPDTASSTQNWRLMDSEEMEKLRSLEETLRGKRVLNAEKVKDMLSRAGLDT